MPPTDEVSVSAVGPATGDDDGALEVRYVDSRTSELRYVDDVLGDETTAAVTTADGERVTVGAAGVA